MGQVSWLKGLIEGDGYIDDRHVEVYNSSSTVLRETAKILKNLIATERIKVDIYTENPEEKLIGRWSRTLGIPQNNFRIRSVTSPWKARSEKIRVRVASKDLADKIRGTKKGASFIKGLFDAEGSVDIKGYIEFKQVERNKKLVEEVHRFVEELGLKTTPVRIKQDKLKKDAYFYVKDIRGYKQKIGFVDSDKTRKIEILLKVNNRNPSTITATGKTLWQIIEETKCPYHVVRRHLIARQTR